ncbi:MAG: shikimate kinase [Rhodospirillales bacterium]
MSPAPNPPILRPVVLVGLMGAGKTCIGARLAERLGLEFADADTEIEAAAGCSIEDIFVIYGEPAFRDVERRVIARLLSGPVKVIATGGGAFMDQETRAAVKAHATSIWLRADLDLLLNRVGRRNNRPLLKKGDPREVLKRLMAERYPAYAEADLVVDGTREPPDATVDRVIEALRDHAARTEAAT